MAKLYWAWTVDSNSWFGPCETDALCIEEARAEIPDVDVIWIAPVDAELDDDDAFWDALADYLLVWGVENAVETLVEDGWIDGEDGWTPVQRDPDRVVANALRQVLGSRPDWRTVDTAKARRVEL